MKLRVRVNKQTSLLELDGGEPSLTELSVHIKEILLPSFGLSPETDFTLSLNGKEPLTDSGQTLSSCGIVSGDLICIILAQLDPPVSTAPSGSQLASAAPSNRPHLEKPSSDSQNPAEATTSSISSQVLMKKAEQNEEAGLEEEQAEEPAPLTLEPMLCSEAEDGKVPHSLEILHHTAHSQGPCDSLMVAVHLLMVETGFIPQDPEVRPGEMPPGWRAQGGVYRLRYCHPLCDCSLATMVAVPMGNMLVLNATLNISEGADSTQKLLLKPSAYVTDAWGGEDAATVFRDLKKLSRVIRDQLVYPLIAVARQAMNLPAVFGLAALPPELLLRVLRLLDVASVVALSFVGKDLHAVTADPSLWRHLYHRDFRDPTNRPWETDWKELYKKKYKQKREQGLFRRTRLFHPIPPQPLPFNPFPHGPNPLFPPGIIGGEYDQRPGIPYYLPRPRFDPIGPQPGHRLGLPIGRQPPRPSSSWSSDIKRGFI